MRIKYDEIPNTYKKDNKHVWKTLDHICYIYSYYYFVCTRIGLDAKSRCRLIKSSRI